MTRDDRFEEVRRGSHPPTGEIAWLDPRVEDPLDFFWLDLDSFAVAARLDRPDPRADFMLHAFRNVINEEPILEARAMAYKDFSRAVKEYIASASLRHRSGIQAEIRRRPHPMVWQTMQRRHTERPELVALFSAAPEALTW